jgi:16S rRNA processing protein RimM
VEYFKLGKLVAVHGLHGELLLKHFLGKRSSLKGLRAVFIEEHANSFLPWFVESSKIKSDEETYLKFEGIATREAAMKLLQKTAWISEQDFKKFAAKTSPSGLLGYTIINSATSLGEITEVIEQPHQLLIKLIINNKEALIPLHEDFVKKIDHRKKQVVVELPEGLLEIYLD